MKGLIIGVAVKEKDVMVCLPKPNRHHDCIRYAVEVLGIDPPFGCRAIDQGFYLADGTYLQRAEALQYVKNKDQLTNKEAKCYLFSEDLW